jgi:hypothetical protein
MCERRIRVSVIVAWCAALIAVMPASASAAWTKEATVNPSSEESALLEVSCWSSGKCVAVGDYHNETTHETEPLVERDSGGAWTKETAPLPTGAQAGTLNGVSCPSKEFCMASGVYVNSGGKETAFADEYTSGVWKEVTLSLPGTAIASELDRISCASTSMCMTVGVYATTGGELLPFSEYWLSGHGASLEYPPGSAEAVLVGVSCKDTSECMAVGWTKKAVLADRWSSGTWTQTTSAGSTYSPVRLFGVDCLAPELECTGVGWGTSSGTELTMSEEYTKTGGWVKAKTSNPSATKDILAAVGCWEKSKCIGVGEENTNPKEVALIEKLEGSSATVETPATVTGAESSRLLGVACLVETTSNCMSVGYYVNKSGHRTTLAESN